ncbi:biotin synthase [Streptomyces sp. BK022]|uniref:biotin synthase BioB n=1 Tax=Streptomyces sp. BK022 TaxID=2512123 RepID=UPI00102A6257|nr:radical SAM protein [Streptomyces sp. BK022]RZU45741.1 biotin synthase [Streptomyces sp. BK022]
MLDEHEIIDMLKLRGKDQEELFAKARKERQRVFENRVVLRGVTEIGNTCRVNCEFCPMRRENTRDNATFLADEKTLIESAEDIKDSGINVVFFQAGEIPQTTRVVGSALPTITKMFDGDVEILLNLGNKKRSEYEWLREQGATSYIIKHETSDPDLNLRMRHETLESRLKCMSDLLELGFKVGSGGIIGLPGQTLESIARDIILARDMGIHMCSFSPFVPAPETPLAHLAPGDVDTTLNALAASRLVSPDWLIPSVSALAKNRKDGQKSGYLAGANVMTVNFTPKRDSERYLIYGKNRFVVRPGYGSGLLAELGLVPGRSVFAGKEALPEFA